MRVIQIFLYSILIISGIFCGIYLSNECKDEIKKWKKRLLIIFFISLILIFIIFFSGLKYKIPLVFSLSFVAITSLTIIKTDFLKKKFEKIKKVCWFKNL